MATTTGRRPRKGLDHVISDFLVMDGAGAKRDRVFDGANEEDQVSHEHLTVRDMSRLGAILDNLPWDPAIKNQFRRVRTEYRGDLTIDRFPDNMVGRLASLTKRNSATVVGTWLRVKNLRNRADDLRVVVEDLQRLAQRALAQKKSLFMLTMFNRRVHPHRAYRVDPSGKRTRIHGYELRLVRRSGADLEVQLAPHPRGGDCVTFSTFKGGLVLDPCAGNIVDLFIEDLANRKPVLTGNRFATKPSPWQINLVDAHGGKTALHGIDFAIEFGGGLGLHIDLSPGKPRARHVRVRSIGGMLAMSLGGGNVVRIRVKPAAPGLRKRLSWPASRSKRHYSRGPG